MINAGTRKWNGKDGWTVINIKKKVHYSRDTLQWKLMYARGTPGQRDGKQETTDMGGGVRERIRTERMLGKGK